jgi:hypothetical protein
MIVTRTDEEIANLMGDVLDQIAAGETAYPGLTYEEGIRAVLDWIQGETQQHPMREDEDG